MSTDWKSRIKTFLCSPFFIFFIIELCILSLWWAAFYPGVMSPDSLDQWQQATQFRFNDWHPYLHSLFIWFLRLFWNNPAMISLFQVFVTALLFAWIFSFFIKKGVNKYLVWVLYAFFALSVPIGIYSVTLWKDVPFSLAMVGTAFFLTYLFIEKVEWKLKHVLLLLILSIALIYFRHNGIIYILFLPLIVIYFFRKQKMIKIYIGLLAASFLFLSFLLPNLINLTPQPFWLKNLFIYQATAGFYSRLPYSHLNQETVQMMEQLLPKEEIKTAYNPADTSPLIWNKKVNVLNSELFNSPRFWDVITRNFWRYDLWANLPLFLGDKLTMFVTVAGGFGMLAGNTIVPNDIILVSTPLSTDLHNYLQGLLNFFAGNSLTRAFFGLSWVGILLLIFLFLKSICNKIYPFQIFSVIILLQLPFLYVFNVAGDWRYMYFMHLSFFIAVPVYLISKRYMNTKLST